MLVSLAILLFVARAGAQAPGAETARLAAPPTTAAADLVRAEAEKTKAEAELKKADIEWQKVVDARRQFYWDWAYRVGLTIVALGSKDNADLGDRS